MGIYSRRPYLLSAVQLNRSSSSKERALKRHGFNMTRYPTEYIRSLGTVGWRIESFSRGSLTSSYRKYVERLNEHSLEDCLGRWKATAIYIVGGWVCHDFNKIRPPGDEARLLILDGHGSHITVEVLWTCKQKFLANKIPISKSDCYAFVSR
jgi:hypothetical protein